MKIKFIKRVIFRDQNDTVVKVFEIGDVVDYTAKADYYFVTGMGGIYFDEAEELL